MNNVKKIMWASMLIVMACSANQKNTGTSQETEWPKMDEFHMIMAESFHPYMDSGNLEPAKAYADELVRLAEEWKQSELPQRVDNEEVRRKLDELVAESKKFAEMKDMNNDDAQAGEVLNSLHDIFHHLQDAWYGGGRGH